MEGEYRSLIFLPKSLHFPPLYKTEAESGAFKFILQNWCRQAKNVFYFGY